MTGFWNIAKTAGGFLVGLVAVLTWLNVTPEMVGEAVYANLFLLLPLAMFAGGVLSGWGFASIQHERRAALAEKKRAAATAGATKELESLHAEVEALRSFREGAEPRLAHLAEIEDRFNLKKYSGRQIKAMLDCLDAERKGQGYVLAPLGNPYFRALRDAGVVDCDEFAHSGDLFAFNLTPDWRLFLSENEDGLRDVLDEWDG